MQGRRIRRAVTWGLVLAWSAAIFVVSGVPGSDLPPNRFSSVAHFVEYAILGGLLYVALRTDRTRRVAALAAVALASLYGASDELHQSFVPMRYPDVMDWVVDTAGAAVSVTVAAFIDRATERRRSG